MSSYIDQYTALFSQLEFMGKDVATPESQKTHMPLSSIDPECMLEPVAAALQTKISDGLIWEFVSTTIIDAYDARHNLTGNTGKKQKPSKHRSNKSRSSINYDAESCSDGPSNLEGAAQAFAAVYKNQKSAEKKSESENKCDFCNKNGCNENSCFLNPDNSDNRLSS